MILFQRLYIRVLKFHGFHSQLYTFLVKALHAPINFMFFNDFYGVECSRRLNKASYLAIELFC